MPPGFIFNATNVTGELPDLGLTDTSAALSFLDEEGQCTEPFCVAFVVLGSIFLFVALIMGAYLYKSKQTAAAEKKSIELEKQREAEREEREKARKEQEELDLETGKAEAILAKLKAKQEPERDPEEVEMEQRRARLLAAVTAEGDMQGGDADKATDAFVEAANEYDPYLDEMDAGASAWRPSELQKYAEDEPEPEPELEVVSVSVLEVEATPAAADQVPVQTEPTAAPAPAQDVPTDEYYVKEPADDEYDSKNEEAEGEGEEDEEALVRRVAWIKYYVTQGDEEQARQLGWNGDYAFLELNDDGTPMEAEAPAGAPPAAPESLSQTNMHRI